MVSAHILLHSVAYHELVSCMHCDCVVSSISHTENTIRPTMLKTLSVQQDTLQNEKSTSILYQWQTTKVPSWE